MGTEGEQMYSLAKRLFPICRSITGDGVRETLHIIKEQIPIMVVEVPTGTRAFDWTVPQEWNIRDAYIADEHGTKVIDFKNNNLHVMSYSVPVDEKITLAELQKHLYSLPEQPTAIPYITSYYKKQWGFCLSENDRQQLKDGIYHVYIDSELKDGSLTYGELIIPGASEKEILLSTYVCHPSMANNELSGPVVTTYLAKWLREKPRHYTYRIVFIPETIGSLVYMQQHLDEMKKNIVAGFNITCVGDERAYSFLPSRTGGTLADKVAKAELSRLHPNFIEYSFLDRGSDERQYCAPGVDLPVVSVMRSKYHAYPEYHTSLDDLSLVTPGGLFGAYEVLQACIKNLESRPRYRSKTLGEPQLSRRDLYPATGTKQSRLAVRNMMNVLAYCDGTNDVSELSALTALPLEEVNGIIEILKKNDLLTF